MSAAIAWKRVLTRRVMARLAYVASPITRLISLEMVEALGPPSRQRSVVAVMRIEPVIDVPVKAVRAVKPGPCSNKHPADKPIGPVVAVRSTVIRSIVEVSVRTYGSWSDIHSNRNLSWRRR
jgi:hypothetical protein